MRLSRARFSDPASSLRTPSWADFITNTFGFEFSVHTGGRGRISFRLGAVERLDWALLINREDNGVSGRIDIEADDVPELLGKFRVVRQLEGPDTVGREVVGFENALHRTQAHPDRLGQFPAGPVGCFPRWRPQRQVDHPLHSVGRQWRLAGACAS